VRSSLAVLGIIVVLGMPSRAADERAALSKSADRIVIVKSTQTLTLLNHGQVLKTYKVALGGDPAGPKMKAGDKKTPEGEYIIDSKNPHSRFHLALHISYPNAADRERARKVGVSPGGGVEIHGLEAKYAWVGSLHRRLTGRRDASPLRTRRSRRFTSSFQSVRRLKSGPTRNPSSTARPWTRKPGMCI
jgi:hypothetical protein